MEQNGNHFEYKIMLCVLYFHYRTAARGYDIVCGPQTSTYMLGKPLIL